MRISTIGNALSLTFVLTYLPLALLRFTHMGIAGGWNGPMTQAMPQTGAMGPGWTMGGPSAGGWHMAGYGLTHVAFGAVVAYVLGWYVAAVFVSLYRLFERRASNKPD